MEDLNTLQGLISTFVNQIEDNDYEAIMTDKRMSAKRLGALLNAFNKAEIAPFDALTKLGDIPWFAQQLWDMRRGWITGYLVRAWDSMQSFDWQTTEGIAKAAYALGAKVWYTDRGYYGSPDYMISWRTKDFLFNSEELEDYDPEDFKEVQWTDSELYN